MQVLCNSAPNYYTRQGMANYLPWPFSILNLSIFGSSMPVRREHLQHHGRSFRRFWVRNSAKSSTFPLFQLSTWLQVVMATHFQVKLIFFWTTNNFVLSLRACSLGKDVFKGRLVIFDTAVTRNGFNKSIYTTILKMI